MLYFIQGPPLACPIGIGDNCEPKQKLGGVHRHMCKYGYLFKTHSHMYNHDPELTYFAILET